MEKLPIRKVELEKLPIGKEHLEKPPIGKVISLCSHPVTSPVFSWKRALGKVSNWKSHLEKCPIGKVSIGKVSRHSGSPLSESCPQMVLGVLVLPGKLLQ